MKKSNNSKSSAAPSKSSSRSSSSSSSTTTTTTTTTSSLKSLLSSQALLCNAPILVLVAVASLDNADKQLLASSYSALEQTLGLNVQTLGYFSLFSNLSYALSLPVWGYLLHTYGLSRIHLLLSSACGAWGLATIGIALSATSIAGQAIFRALVGAALGSILPLSQTLLVELVLPEMRGRAFGLMALCENVAGTLAASSIIYVGPQHWTLPYYALGMLSLGMAVVSRRHLNPAHIPVLLQEDKDKDSDDDDDDVDNHGDDDHSKNDKEHQLSLREIIQRIARIPAFMCMVAQGIFGGTPWEMMSYLLLLLDWRGFTQDQIVMMQFTMGASKMLGQWMGGMLGDAAEARLYGGVHGRIAVAFVSVAGGIPLYGLFLFCHNFHWAMLWINLFMMVASWTPSAALRPLCAALTRNASERAQIVSMWIVLERLSGAVFGAPLVGYLTSRMLSSKDQDQNEKGLSETKASALAWNLFALSTLFWSICAFFWILMAYTMPRGGQRMMDDKQKQQDYHHDENEKDEVSSRMELASLISSK